ncbi:MAG: XRE family transcriptional regulator [Actinomycetota bacterium]|nr:XRE family transcriptional regulator [Actinomycetota bacterium]
MGRNERVHDAMRQAGLTATDLAVKLGIDPKTVERWVTSGRRPHRDSREQAAELLGVPAALLWPDAVGSPSGLSELVGIYRTRTEVSPAMVRSLVSGASQHIDVLAYAALWLWDTVPAFAETLAAKAAHGVKVRVCLGDPDSPAVRTRGEEEGIGDRMAARCRLALDYARPIAGVDPSAVRCSTSTLYVSLLRFDDDVLVNTHLWGNPAGDSPVLHFRTGDARGVAANALRSFERVWEGAQPASIG